MNSSKHYFIVLIIYTLFYSIGFSQQILWELKTDSLNTIENIINCKKNDSFENFKELNNHKDNLINCLKKNGFLELLVSKTTKKNDSTYTTKIKLGKRYRYARLIPALDDRVTDSVLRITLSQKRNHITLPIKELESKLSEIRDHLNNQGYNMSKVTTKSYQFNTTDTVIVTTHINTGNERVIDRIAIKGYSEFPEQVIRRLIKKKHLANSKNIKKINELIEATGMSEIVKESELLFKQDSTILYTYLKKKKSNNVDGLLGFNTLQNGNIELNGYLDLILHNNLNRGESLHLIYRGDNEDQTRLNLKARIPHIFNSLLGVSGELELLRRDSTYQNSKITIGTFYNLNSKTELGFNYESTTGTEGQNNITDVTDFKYNGASLNFNYTIRNNNNIFQPDQFTLHTDVGLGKRSTNNQTENQIKLNASILKNIHLFNKSSLLLIGRINYLDTDNLLFNELHQVGGTNSIRGFNQNSIDTNFFTAINSEFRYQLSSGLSLNTVLDYGIIENFNDKKVESLYSVGIGTSILTNAGILKFNLANGAFKGTNLKFSSTVAHLNLLIRF